MQLTFENLWGRLKRLAGPKSVARPVVVDQVLTKPRKSSRRPTTRERAGDKYDAIVSSMLGEYGVRIRKWRTSMSGVAWEVRYRDGSVSRLIECPKPRSPLSLAIFLHEVGHHAIGLGVFKPRCLEEFHAWRFSLEQLERHGVEITERVRRRVDLSLRYAVGKAKRRGITRLPEELRPYDVPLPRR